MTSPEPLQVAVDMTRVPSWTALMKDGSVRSQQDGEHPTSIIGDVRVLAFETTWSRIVLAPREGSKLDWLSTVDTYLSMDAEGRGSPGGSVRRVGPGIHPGGDDPVRLWVSPDGQTIVLADGSLDHAQQALLDFTEACRKEGE